MQAAHLLQRGSPLSASASMAAISRGLSCCGFRTWAAILIFFKCKKRLRHWKKLQRALSRRWLHEMLGPIFF